jgi:1A family penicillin-binding protein
MDKFIIKTYQRFSKTLLFVRASFYYVKNLFKRVLKSPLRDLFFAIAGFLLIIFLFVLSNVVWAINVNIPTFGQLQNRHVVYSTKIYDRTHKILLYDTDGSMRRTKVPLSDISPYVVKASIAIEDDTFYSHMGVRPISILRALVTNIGSASFGQGGSIITQQVAKNTLLTSDKSIMRKIKEWVIAMRIERQYSKNEIIETYLNETPYGGTIYGIEEASREYFNKSAKDLTLSESAYLASLPKSPTYLSPWGKNASLLTERHNLVLSKMRKLNIISEDEYKKATEEKVLFADKSVENIKAPHFVFYVLSLLEKKYSKEKVYNEGLQITTTLDLNLQKESEQIIREGALKNEKNFNASNASLVAIDPKSGQVLAMVGSRNYFDDSVDGQVNIATSLRQPGSTFKPFAYATAFKKGYTPDTILFDLKTQFSTACSVFDFSSNYPCYSPDNYDEKYRGPMSMRDALAQSINVVGVKTLYLAGMDDTLNTARSLGITTLEDKKRYGLSLVLGGGEVTLLEMTGAYGVFANDGAKYETTPILSVRTKSGQVLESYMGKAEQVIDKEVAREINNILSDNTARTPAFGSDSPLNFKDTVVADKTGTTNDYRDVWVIGYTPSVVVGTWAGNNDNTPMEKKVASFILAPIWHSAMEKAIARFPSTPFPPPEKTIAVLPPSLEGVWDTNPNIGVHEILFWVNKDNPRKEPAIGSFTDPQFALWEYPVELWANELAYSKNIASTSSDYNLNGMGGMDGIPIQITNADPFTNSNVQMGQP